MFLSHYGLESPKVVLTIHDPFCESEELGHQEFTMLSTSFSAWSLCTLLKSEGSKWKSGLFMPSLPQI